MTYFGNSVPEIYTILEDYKPVIICVHCFQIPIYVQLQIIFTLLYIESMPVYFMIQYKGQSMGCQHSRLNTGPPFEYRTSESRRVKV